VRPVVAGVSAMILYHFTSLYHHLPRIIDSGVLRPSESNVGSPYPEHFPHGDHVGPDVVWLLDTPDLGGHPHGLAGSSVDKTRVMFTVDVAAVPWVDWLPAARMDPRWRDLFISSAGGDDAARHWYVYPGVIPRRRWLRWETRETA